MSRGVYSALLIIPTYTKPIDSIEDMLASSSRFFVPKGAAIHYLLRVDPRANVKELMKRHETFNILASGDFPPWIFEGLALSSPDKDLTFSHFSNVLLLASRTVV